ncbi:MAG TPA: hypothetical protein VFR97_15760 [Capillimicrobium sp.]|nr:hypothetical protein [Capillimicrobium sp.]
MLLTLFTTAGLVLWIVLWSIGAKAFDAFMLTVLLALVGATVKLLIPSLSPRRDRS